MDIKWIHKLKKFFNCFTFPSSLFSIAAGLSKFFTRMVNAGDTTYYAEGYVFDGTDFNIGLDLRIIYS